MLLNMLRTLAILSLCFLCGSTFGQTQLGQSLSGESLYDEFGGRLGLSGDGTRMVVTAPNNIGNGSNGDNAGHMRVFDLVGQRWVQVGTDIDGPATLASLSNNRNYSSVGVSRNGARVAFGAVRAGTQGGGLVRVYELVNGAWAQVGGDLNGEAILDDFGRNISMSDSGNIIAIGAPNNDDPVTRGIRGHVRVFELIAGTWTQIGNDIDGVENSGSGGRSVSLSGDGKRVAIGEPFNNRAGLYAGQVRVLEWNGTAWVQMGNGLDGEAAGDRAGFACMLSRDGTRVISGAFFNDGQGTSAGHARVFEWDGVAWGQLGADIDGVSADDRAGFSVAISDNGNRVAVGAPSHVGTGISGHVRVFAFMNGSWTKIQNTINAVAGFGFPGEDVSLSSDGSRVAIGAPYNGNGIVKVFGLCPPDTGHDSLVSCSAYTWVDGKTYTTSNNTATYSLQNADGCDSVVSLDLTVNILESIDTIRACSPHQWIDGNTYSATTNTPTFTVQTSVGCDSIVRLNLTIDTLAEVDVVQACEPYQWIDGNTYSTSTNTPVYTISTASGCDSTITLNLTITALDNGISLNCSTLTANLGGGATYKWYDCSSGFAQVPGQFGQSFTPSKNGSYAVLVGKNGCSKLSDCIDVINVGVYNDAFESTIQVYPNPSTGLCFVDMGGLHHDVSIQIQNAFGQAIFAKSYQALEKTKLKVPGPPGVYFLVIKDNYGNRAVQRILKQ